MGPRPKGITKPKTDRLPAIGPDPLTVVDDPDYFTNLKAEMNLPDYIRTGIEGMYKG